MSEVTDKVHSVYKDRLEEIDKQIEKISQEIKEDQDEIEALKAIKKDVAKERDVLLKNIQNKDTDLRVFQLSTRDSIALDDDLVNRANDWIKKHELRFHTEHALGLKVPDRKAAIGLSHYEIKKGWTSIGSFTSLICTACKESKEVDYNDRVFEIEELD